MEFFKPATKITGKGNIEIFAEYDVCKYNDIMVRGHDFYAIWDEANNLWSTSKVKVVEIIDEELREYYEKVKELNPGSNISVRYLRNSSSRAMDDFNHYVQKQASDNYHDLDSDIIFSNHETNKKSYATKTLSYPLKEGTYSAWNELVSTLYSPVERQKIEWAIGAIVTGNSKWIQKFIIFVGDAGTGKSTIMKIIRQLFESYVGTFDAKALGNPNNVFALEPLKSNPIVAIQDDADLSRIEDNTRLNSLVSHETMTINEKYKAPYSMTMRPFIFLGSNKEVMITDARSGLLRRIIDVAPTGNKIPFERYLDLMNKINFELGAIAYHCKEVYESNPYLYDKYFPSRMISATNHMYDFVEDNHFIFMEEDEVTLTDAWQMYKRYCQDSLISYPLTKQKFKTELRAYFREFIPEGHKADGTHFRNMFKSFKLDKIGINYGQESANEHSGWLEFRDQKSLFDDIFSNAPAQLANQEGIPTSKWDKVHTKLIDIYTREIHYVLLPSNHIVIDFDLKDESGDKSFEKNLEAANKWPETYAELSKSEAGIHLHYIYDGDVDELSSVFAEGIEVKIFKGKSALRRKLTMCNDIPIATISSGLPKKKGDKMISFTVFKNENALRTFIDKNLRKEYHPGTKPSIDFIFEGLEKAYESGISYDVTDLRQKVLAFASHSSNHPEYCVKKVAQMHFMQDKDLVDTERRDIYDEDAPLVFFDVEVFPNLFVVVFKYRGSDNCVKMINPKPEDIEKLCNFKLVGFNCRRYDNHILYGRMRGYNEEQLFNLSQKIINDVKNATFSEAYNLSYTDVYDFASAGNKMSLKKWEIALDIHHLELGLPWDKPVPQDLWDKVADYCVNDVVSTEKVFEHLKGDWTARQILADISGLTVNDTTNAHTTRIIFGNNRHPQDQFNYRDLSKPVTYLDPDVKDFLNARFPYMMKWWRENTDSLLPYFPGYKYEGGKSSYKFVDEVGEGGRVSAVEGMYGGVALDDVESMHPHSAIAECLFGPEYTDNYHQLLLGRLNIKHQDWNKLNDILNGALTKYVEKIKTGEMNAKDLSNALKTAINAVYGLTSAKFEHPFHDIRNKDNIIAKRGALFMIDLEEAVKAKGYTVAHIKTDSIKIPDADKDILDFVKEFGLRYGYNFAHEATYDRMTLVNHAVYIARYSKPEYCKELYGYVPEDNLKHPWEWTATGAQFAEPFVMKSLFTKEPLIFKDYCQTKSVKNNMYLDMNEDLGENEHNYRFVGKVGSFCPIKPGAGGGILLRADDVDSKMSAVVGTKGYRWLESEVVSSLDKKDDIDISYFIGLVDEAVADIEELGDYNWFVSEDEYRNEIPYGTKPRNDIFEDYMNLPEDEDTPPWDEAELNQRKGEKL